MVTEFTPLSAIAGGLLIGLSATLLLLLIGRIAGISGIVHEALARPLSEHGWRLAFVAGLVTGAAAWFALAPAAGIEVPAARESMPVAWLLVAGFLVGFGTRIGAGCTSGHGICGLARFSRRSLAAVVVFMGTAALTVFTVRHLPGGLS